MAYVVVAILLTALLLPVTASAQQLSIDRPAQREYVMDLANLLSASEEVRIREIADRTLKDRGVPIVAVTIESMARHGGGGMSLERFAGQLFDQWGIGEADDSDGGRGILLLVSRDDRVARIELGGGWQQRFDRDAQRILDQTILPQFRQRRFGPGIVAGVEALATMAGRAGGVTTGAAPAPSGATPTPPPTPPPNPADQPVEREGPPAAVPPAPQPAPAPSSSRTGPTASVPSHPSPPMSHPGNGGHVGHGRSGGLNVCATIGACSGIGFLIPLMIFIIIVVKVLSAVMNGVSSIGSPGRVLSPRTYDARRSGGMWDDGFSVRRPRSGPGFGLGLPGLIFGGGGMSSSSRRRSAGGGFTFGGSAGSSRRSSGGSSSRRSFGGGRSGGGGASGSW